MAKNTVALIILDGFGISDTVVGNAIKAAKTPNMDKYFANFPNTTLDASGMSVGLPDGQMGNSELGHTNIGWKGCLSGIDKNYKIKKRWRFF